VKVVRRCLDCPHRCGQPHPRQQRVAGTGTGPGQPLWTFATNL